MKRLVGLEVDRCGQLTPAQQLATQRARGLDLHGQVRQHERGLARIDRLAPCSSQASLAGEIAPDSSLRFTVTQSRWGACTAVGTNQYTGVVHLGSLLANGRVTVQCDDGRQMTVDEQLSGSLSAPPTTPG